MRSTFIAFTKKRRNKRYCGQIHFILDLNNKGDVGYPETGQPVAIKLSSLFYIGNKKAAAEAAANQLERYPWSTRGKPTDKESLSCALRRVI